MIHRGRFTFGPLVAVVERGFACLAIRFVGEAAQPEERAGLAIDARVLDADSMSLALADHFREERQPGIQSVRFDAVTAKLRDHVLPPWRARIVGPVDDKSSHDSRPARSAGPSGGRVAEILREWKHEA